MPPMKVILTGEQITELADFADGTDCTVVNDGSYATGQMEIRRAVIVIRSEDGVKVRIFDNGQIEAIA